MVQVQRNENNKRDIEVNRKNIRIMSEESTYKDENFIKRYELCHNMVREFNEIWAFIGDFEEGKIVDEIDAKIILYNVQKNASISQRPLRNGRVEITLKSERWETYYDGTFMRKDEVAPKAKTTFFALSDRCIE